VRPVSLLAVVYAAAEGTAPMEFTTEVRLVEAAEAAFPLILVTSHGRSSRVRSSCPVDLRLRRETFPSRPSRLRFF